MKITNKTFCLLSLVIFLIAATAGGINVAQGNFSHVSWILTPLEIFIWGDALILGVFLGLGSLFLYFKNNSVWTGLFFSSYFAIRSFFEIVYSLNAQFTTTIRPWELDWKEFVVVKALGQVEIFVISQLLFTCVFIVSILIVVYFLRLYLGSLEVKTKNNGQDRGI